MICASTPENTNFNKVLELMQPQDQASFQQPIVILGQAQIGKTQLLKTLLREVQNKKLYDYIFYVCLKNIDLSDEMNVLQLLTTNQSSLGWIDCQNDYERQLLKRVVENLADAKKSKVCIIFDDFEKSDFFNADYSNDQNIFDILKAGDLVSNTIKGWFKDCQKILLLHPWGYLRLQKTHSPGPMQIVYVKGISPKNAEERDFFSKQHDAKKCSICQTCFNNNCREEILSICCVPNNRKLLKQHHSNIQNSSAVKIAVSLLTTSLTKAFPHYVQDPIKSIEVLLKSCHFAWISYVKNRYLFNENELFAFGLSANGINSLFSCRRKKIGFREDLVFFFSHVLLQELLATMWLLLIPTEQLKAELPDIEKSLSKETKAVFGEFLSEIHKLSSADNGRIVPPLKVNEENIELLESHFGKVTIREIRFEQITSKV